MVVVSARKFANLLNMVKGLELVDAEIILHDDNSGNFDEVVLKFKDGKDQKVVSFTPEWEHRKSDRDIIDTTLVVDVTEMVTTRLIK